tara:strand:+ start:20516 stop:20794 length:279 start_codon:yes stop_codon:yes gene_type:complete
VTIGRDDTESEISKRGAIGARSCADVENGRSIHEEVPLEKLPVGLYLGFAFFDVEVVGGSKTCLEIVVNGHTSRMAKQPRNSKWETVHGETA